MAPGAVIDDYFLPTDCGKSRKKQRLLTKPAFGDTRYSSLSPTSVESHNEELATLDASSSDYTITSNRSIGSVIWQPRHEHCPAYLGELKSGPQRIIFTARVVNIYHVKINNNSPSDDTRARQNARGLSSTVVHGSNNGNNITGGAKGCWKLLAKDDSGCIQISLWYADADYEDLLIGSLISVWTTHISAPKPGLARGTAASTLGGSNSASTPIPQRGMLTTSIFPERDRGCYLLVHAGKGNLGTGCRMPLGYREGGVPGWSLDLLADVLGKGNQVRGESTRVLVYVKAIGSIQRYINSQGIAVEKIDVGLSDESGAEVILSLFGQMMRSALLCWVPHSRALRSTVLLISNANWKRTSHRLAVNSRTMIEVDPDIVEADWLRKLADNTVASINPAWPDGVLDAEAFANSPVKAKFTLKDIDEFVRSAPSGNYHSNASSQVIKIIHAKANTGTETFMGYASVMITKVNIVALYKEGRLFCTECCNMPILANVSTEICGQCGNERELNLNPQIIGTLIDETGAISISGRPDTELATAVSVRAAGSQQRAVARNGASPLLWSHAAWHDLLGCKAADLAPFHGGTRQLENSVVAARVLTKLEMLAARLMFLRATICFGWSPQHGRGKLMVCRVLK